MKLPLWIFYKKKICIVYCSLFFSLTVLAQKEFTISIHVTDEFNLPIPHASVSINQKKLKADSLGNVDLKIAPGNYYISISSVNHYPFNSNSYFSSNVKINPRLETRQSLMGNVTIINSRNVNRNQLGVQNISSAQLKKMPFILGEVDPLKAISLLPGIKNGGEASAGIYVRGGGPDQNLVLLDGFPVYNPNHLFGFFSIFNGDAVKNVEVIKGGIPAEYGGRLSSVIAIESREGNKDSIKGSAGIGLIASRLSLEGPLLKNKSSFIISARRTYIDQIAKAVAKKSIGGNGYFFYDINAKADYLINKNNRLMLTFYTGADDFSYNKTTDGRSRSFNTFWGNTVAGINWNQKLNTRLKQQTSILYDQFALDSRLGFNTINFIFTSALKDYQLKTDWQLNSNNWLTLKWGGQYSWHQFTPGAGSVTSGIQEFKSNITNQFAREAAVYVSTDINLTPKLNVIAGMRYSYFSQVGPSSKLLYNSNGEPTGVTETYLKGQRIAQYHYPEPRLNVLYKLPNTSSLKASYTRTIQYLHLATTSSATFPSDLWIPSSKLVKPAIAEQFAAGYFKNFNNNKFELSVETYFKTMSNQIEFKPGTQLLLNQNMEGEMIFGSGKAYGIELFFQKKMGRLTGWVGYTISRTERKFEKLNEGKTFIYRYDRTHDLSIVANYSINKKWEAAAVFVYGTGNALTLPTGRFTYNLGFDNTDQTLIFTNVNQYEKINEYRMPAYHRLDISFTYKPKPASIKRYKSSWNFSLYNVYNNYNPFFIYLDANEEQRTIQGKKIFLFPIIPGITWNCSF